MNNGNTTDKGRNVTTGNNYQLTSACNFQQDWHVTPIDICVLTFLGDLSHLSHLCDDFFEEFKPESLNFSCGVSRKFRPIHHPKTGESQSENQGNSLNQMLT
jgi:hypothetical protein